MAHIPSSSGRISVEWLTFRTLLVALDRRDVGDAPAQDRRQLVVGELVDGAVDLDARGGGSCAATSVVLR
jgi:hypothetical protein